MASSTRSWPPTEKQLADDLAKVLTVGVGQPLRGKAMIDTLAAVAAYLSDDSTLPPLRQAEDAVSESIGRLGSSRFANATALVFGVADKRATMRTVAARRRLAATELGVGESALKESHEPRMCLAIASDLLKRLPETLLPETASSPAPDIQPVPIADDDQARPTTTAARRFRPALAVLLAVLGLAIALLALQPWNEAGASTHELARLTAEAERPLALSQTPLPGTTTPLLGFGDENGGRPYFQYVNRTKVPGYPVLDSFIDAPEHVGEERMFLRVEAAPKLPKNFVLRLTPSAAAAGHDLAFVWIYVANDAPQQSNCSELVGPTVATNTRIRLTVWNSPNNRLHVVRGWISADNAYPKWITDAAAVITAKAAPLSFDPADSWQYSIFPSKFAHEAPLPNQTFFDAGGMPLSSKGLLGSCWSNRWAMVLAFNQ
jgi:hypothetical protein